MKKVIVTTRAVYHKVATVEVNVPSTVEDENVQDWLWDNEHLFIDELDDNLDNAKLEYGFGVDTDNGMVWKEEESETRYDVYDEMGDVKYGGHC
jgi:hypothetical protein